MPSFLETSNFFIKMECIQVIKNVRVLSNTQLFSVFQYHHYRENSFKINSLIFKNHPVYLNELNIKNVYTKNIRKQQEKLFHLLTIFTGFSLYIKFCMYGKNSFSDKFISYVKLFLYLHYGLLFSRKLISQNCCFLANHRVESFRILQTL